MSGDNSRPEPEREWTPEEKARAERAEWILYGVMMVFIVLPFLVFW